MEVDDGEGVHGLSVCVCVCVGGGGGAGVAVEEVMEEGRRRRRIR